MKKITKKTIATAPKFAAAIDYTANYKPMTIDTVMVEAADVYEAMEKVEAMYEEHGESKNVWCITLYEKTETVKDDCIMYDERLQLMGYKHWCRMARTEFHIGYQPEDKWSAIC